jgi:hypothetical protein
MFDLLVARGFLDITRASAFNVKSRLARTWRLTTEPCNGQPATRDFMRWSASTGTVGSAPKSGIQSVARDAQSPDRDGTAAYATTLPATVPLARPSPRAEAALQSPQWDTSILPSGSAANGAGAQAKANRERALLTRYRQLDLVNFVAGLAPAAPPLDVLRLEARVYVKANGRGSVKRLAGIAGVSGAQMSNFIGGRFGLNAGAAAMLRDYLATADASGASATKQ